MNMMVPPPDVPAPRRGRRSKLSREAIEACRVAGLTKDDACLALDCSLATLTKMSDRYGVQWPRSRGKTRSDRFGRARSRFAPKHSAEKPTRAMPAVSNPAFTERRTIYPATRTDPADSPVLISGWNAWKIGGQIAKGRWAGFPVYTVTLEERATCPTSCQHWRSCFGNNMHLAHRITAGADYEARLAEALVDAAERHRDGFAVRLHVLGDFYSVAYVELWRWFLDNIPQVHCFGFSARIDHDDPIAQALVRLVIEQWDRFAIRFSNAPVDECSTVTIEHPLQKPADAVICPQQFGKTDSCSTCALCWHSKRRIAFLRH